MKKLFFYFVLLCATFIINAQEVAVNGNRFTVDNSEIWFNGINTPWHLFVDFGRSDFNPTWWSDEFARYKDNHINLARVWIHMSGEVSPDIDATGHVSGTNNLFWDHMDHLMDVAEANQVYVLPALFSFDITKNGYKTTAEWRAHIKSEANIQSYIDNVLIPLVQRYDNRPYLLAWEICNEPEWMFENSEHGPQAFADIQKWHAMLAAAIHENSSKMVTTGSAAPKWNSPIYDNWGEYEGNMFSDEALSATINNTNAYLDFYQYHWYPWQSQYMQSPFTKTTAEYQVDDRPVIVGESEGNDVCDQYVCQTVTEMYVSAYSNGFDGVAAWKTPQNDGHGTFENIAVATNAFYKIHPDLVYPTGSDPVPVTGLTLSATAVRVQERSAHKLTATLIPSNASDRRMSWSTADASVATVVNGVVTGVAPGNTTVTVTTNDGGFTAQSSVEVTERTAICENPSAITLPFDKDGAGVFCFVTAANIDYVNSWNLKTLEINGAEFTNVYTNAMPPREDGNYYIYYEGNFAYSHLEVRGSGGGVTQNNLVTSVVGQGSVAPASGTYDAGTLVNLTATPVQGWKFSQWSGDASGTSATTSVTMDANKSVTATFTEIVNPIDYTLTVSTTGQGSVSLDPVGGSYTEGTVVNLTALPATGYQFDIWSGDLNGSINPTRITMSANKSVTANFCETSTTVCENPVGITIPFTKDGVGDFCWSTTQEPGYVNSWNLAELTINGVDFTNSWSNRMPPVENGKWIIHYVANYAWSHFEIPQTKRAE